MPEGPDLTELCAWAVEAAEGEEEVEAYAEEDRRTRVRVRGGEVEEFVFAEGRGVGVRVIAGGRQGYSYAADPSADEIAAVVRAARESARFAEPDDGNALPSLGPVDPLPEIFRPAQLEVPAERKVELALELERVAVSTDPAVRKVESADHGDEVGRVVLASTKGGPLEYRRTDTYASVVCLAERDGETQTGFAFRLAREADGLDWADAAREAATRAARLLGATKPNSERVAVVLDPYAAASFLSVLAGALSADSAQKGRSLFASLVGQPVASDAVTLIDDGRLLDGSSAAPFDDEGVATRRTPLIEGGVLRGFLHNHRTATRSGARSTGNAARGGYRTVPAVAPSNLFVSPGSAEPAELLRRAGRALYVQEVTGLHSGANPISGEFSVGATGLRVLHGELAEPLREMTIASTLLDVLRGVAAAGSDLRFVGGSLGSPTILVEEMTVGGT